MAIPSLIVAGKSLSIMSRLDCEQRIEPIGGSTTRRLSNGAAFKMSHWAKSRIVLSGSGWFPAALRGIDYTQPFEIELPYPEALAVGEGLPPGFSARGAPWDERSVTDKFGQAVRLVYLKTMVISDGPSSSGGSSGNYSWELTLEQT